METKFIGFSKTRDPPENPLSRHYPLPFSTEQFSGVIDPRFIPIRPSQKELP